MPLDETLRSRSLQLQTVRDALLEDIAKVRQEMLSPPPKVLPSMVETFCKGVRQKLQDKDFAKRYLQLLVEKIVVTEDRATIVGDKRKLAAAVESYKIKKGTAEVPSFMCVWRARSDSNARPLGS